MIFTKIRKRSDILDYLFDEEFTQQTFHNLFSRLKVLNQAEFINFTNSLVFL